MVRDITLLDALLTKYGDEATIKHAIAFEKLYFKIQCHWEKVESKKKYLYLNGLHVPAELVKEVNILDLILLEFLENPYFEVLSMTLEEVVEFYRKLLNK